MDIQRILCPVDFSEYSQQALALAASLAKDNDATLHLLYVYDPNVAAAAGFAGYAPAPDETERLEQELQSMESPVAEVRVQRTVISGTPTHEIVRFANENNMDLIVMGTHGRTGVSRMLMGSVAESVLRAAACPVLTIRQPASVMQSASQ